MPGTVPGTRLRYDAGDLEIQIEPWLQRDVSGGDERRTFRTWAATAADEEAGLPADPGPKAGEVYTINSTELRAVHLRLQPVAPPGGAPLAGSWRACGAPRRLRATRPGSTCRAWSRRCTGRCMRRRRGSCGRSPRRTKI